MRACSRLQGPKFGERDSVGDFHGRRSLAKATAAWNRCLKFALAKSKRASAASTPQLLVSTVTPASRATAEPVLSYAPGLMSTGEDPWRFAGDSATIAMIGR